MKRARKPLSQMADAIQNATEDFLRIHPLSRYQPKITAAMERSLEEICRRHGTPFRTVRKIVDFS